MKRIIRRIIKKKKGTTSMAGDMTEAGYSNMGNPQNSSSIGGSEANEYLGHLDSLKYGSMQSGAQIMDRIDSMKDRINDFNRIDSNKTSNDYNRFDSTKVGSSSQAVSSLGGSGLVGAELHKIHKNSSDNLDS